jgi:exosortase/archaeosortase
MVSLFEVFYVFFINFSALNSKIIPRFIHHVQFFLTKLNVYFHERDSLEQKVRTIAVCVSCRKQLVSVFFNLDATMNSIIQGSRMTSSHSVAVAGGRDGVC